jgi:PAS domain S-box-containing protein
LRSPEDHYHTLVELSPDGVISLNSHAQIVSANSEACRLLGCAPWEIEGRPVQSWLTSSVQEPATPWLDNAARDGMAETEFELHRRDGKIVLVWVRAVSFGTADAGSRRTAIYLRDIAQRRKLDMLREDLAGLIAHEIRSPLTVIRGAVDTVLVEWERLPQEEMRQLLQDAALEAESLSNVTANLLELSRVQANRLLLHVEPVRVQAIVRDTISQVGRQTDRHWFSIDVPEGLPPVHADQLRLQRIMHNLVENAVKY